MKRKILSVLICVMLLVLLIPGVASARGNDAGLQQTAGIVQRYSNVQFKRLELMVERTNRQIELAVKFAQITPWNDVPQLLEFVNSSVADVMAYANSIGAVVVCEYTTYYIDGQSVLIDPLRIIPL